MTITHELFDIDGTLVGSNELHVLTWEKALRAGGHAFDPRSDPTKQPVSAVIGSCQYHMLVGSCDLALIATARLDQE